MPACGSFLDLPKPPDSPSANRLATLIDKLVTKERKRAAEKQRFVHVPTEPIQAYFGPEVMLKACEAIRDHFSFLENRCIYYFIDDYSHPKITEDLQANLNRLLMYRRAPMSFSNSRQEPGLLRASGRRWETVHRVKGIRFAESGLTVPYRWAEAGACIP